MNKRLPDNYESLPQRERIEVLNRIIMSLDRDLQTLRTDLNIGLDTRKSYHGFEVDENLNYSFDLVYDPDTRTLTFSSYLDKYIVWINGVKYVKKISDFTVTHANANGKYYVYFDTNGDIQTSTTAWDIFNDCPITQIVYYTSGTPKGFATEERHTYNRSRPWHAEHHSEVGTIATGNTLTGYTLNDSSSNASVQVVTGTGYTWDEDIRITNLASTAGTYTKLSIGGTSEAPYLGWTKVTNDVPYYYAGGGTNAPLINIVSGGNWTTQVVTNLYYFNVYLVKIPINEDTSFQSGYWMGQFEYQTLQEAINEQPGALVIAGVIPAEIAPIYKLTFRYGTAYTGTSGRCRIMNVERITTGRGAFNQGSLNISGKMDKIAVPVTNNVLKMDSTGNAADAGFLASSVVTSLTGDVTGTGSGATATTIANAAVTLAKMANLSAPLKIIGRYSSGAGVPQELTVSTGLAVDGSGNLTTDQTSYSTYSPTCTSTGGNFSTPPTTDIKYKQDGKTIHLEGRVSITSTTGASGYLLLPLPVTSISSAEYCGVAREQILTGVGYVIIPYDTNTCMFVKSSDGGGSIPGVSIFDFSLRYQAA